MILSALAYHPVTNSENITAAPLGVEIIIDMPVGVTPATRWLTPNSVLTITVDVTNNNVITGTQCTLEQYEINLQENTDIPTFTFVSPSVVSGPSSTAFFTLTAPSFVTMTTFYAIASAYYTCTNGPLGISQRGDSEAVMVWNEIYQLYLPLVTQN